MATADLKAMDQVHLGGNGHGNGNGNDYTDHTTSPQSTTSTNSNSNNSKNGHKVTYEDPDADVSLRSSDGRIFKVESYVLKTHSSYFRNLFKSNGIPQDPIQINATTKILKSLLDIMHTRPVAPDMVWSLKSKLLALCDTLGTPSVAERAVYSMHDNVHKDPWGVFSLASQRGNVSLAKAALKYLAEDEEHHGHKIERLTPQLAAGVTLPYLLGLFNTALKVRSGGDEGEEGTVGWKSIADNFYPVVG